MPNFVDIMDKLNEMDNRLDHMYTALAVLYDMLDKQCVEKLR